MDNLIFIDASAIGEKAKCRIQKNGITGFSSAGATWLGITTDCGLLFAPDPEGIDSLILYMKIERPASSKSFKVNKAGSYFYSRTKRMFDTLGIDYKNKTIIFDITKVDGENMLYKLTGRTREKKKNE